jgi:hypothetical protein
VSCDFLFFDSNDLPNAMGWINDRFTGLETLSL